VSWCNLETLVCVHQQKDCADNNPCTIDSCDSGTEEGCVHVNDP